MYVCMYVCMCVYIYRYYEQGRPQADRHVAADLGADSYFSVDILNELF